jgi:hypothetical protein
LGKGESKDSIFADADSLVKSHTIASERHNPTLSSKATQRLNTLDNPMTPSTTVPTTNLVERGLSQTDIQGKLGSIMRQPKSLKFKGGFLLDKKKKHSETAKKAFILSRNKKDMENYMVGRIYEQNVFKEVISEHGAINYMETAESEKTFREMVPASKDSRVTNMKIKKTWLNAYLKERYSQRLATKMCALLDWGNATMRFDAFHKELNTRLT